MRSRFAFLLTLTALGGEMADAQRPTPSGIARPPVAMPARRVPTRFIQRMHRYGNWGAAAGTMTGFATGMLTTPANEDRGYQLIIHMMLGASVGNLGGLIVGLNERHPSDTLPAPISPDVLRSPFPVLASRLDNMSSYVGMGGRVGASFGVITGALLATDDDFRGLSMLFGGLTGFTGGMAVGGATYLIKRAR